MTTTVKETEEFSSLGVYAADKAELKKMQEEYASDLQLARPVSLAQVVHYLIKEHRAAEKGA